MLFMLAGFLIWGAHFTAIYGFNAVVCARGLGADAVIGIPMVAVGVTVLTFLAFAALAGTTYLAWSGQRPLMPDGSGPELAAFVRHTTLLACAMGAVGVIWDAVPVFLVPPCA